MDRHIENRYKKITAPPSDLITLFSYCIYRR